MFLAPAAVVSLCMSGYVIYAVMYEVTDFRAKKKKKRPEP